MEIININQGDNRQLSNMMTSSAVITPVKKYGDRSQGPIMWEDGDGAWVTSIPPESICDEILVRTLAAFPSGSTLDIGVPMWDVNGNITGIDIFDTVAIDGNHLSYKLTLPNDVTDSAGNVVGSIIPNTGHGDYLIGVVFHLPTPLDYREEDPREIHLFATVKPMRYHTGGYNN